MSSVRHPSTILRLLFPPCYRFPPFLIIASSSIFTISYISPIPLCFACCWLLSQIVTWCLVLTSTHSARFNFNHFVHLSNSFVFLMLLAAFSDCYVTLSVDQYTFPLLPFLLFPAYIHHFLFLCVSLIPLCFSCCWLPFQIATWFVVLTSTPSFRFQLVTICHIFLVKLCFLCRLLFPHNVMWFPVLTSMHYFRFHFISSLCIFNPFAFLYVAGCLLRLLRNS